MSTDTPTVLTPWDDNLTQFARLLCEIVATHESLDLGVLAEATDLSIEQVGEILERAHTHFEAAKAGTTADPYEVGQALTAIDAEGFGDEVDDDLVLWAARERYVGLPDPSRDEEDSDEDGDDSVP